MPNSCRILLFLSKLHEIGALAPTFPAKGSWGDTQQTTDVGGEVAVVGEPYGSCDLGEGEVGVGEQRLCPLDAPVDYVLVRREAGCSLERAREVVGAHVRSPGYLGHIFFGPCGIGAMCALTTLYHCVTLHPTCGRMNEDALSEVSETAQRKVSGLMLKISRLLAPPIHPRVSTVAVPSALRLISLAGRDGVLRSA